jgi:hypothetical protein
MSSSLRIVLLADIDGVSVDLDGVMCSVSLLHTGTDVGWRNVLKSSLI